MVTCPFCAEQIPEASAYCSFCGGALGDSPRQTPPSPPSRSGLPVWAILLIVFGLGGCLIIPILAAMLLPALGAVKERAERVKCDAHLQGIHMGMMRYEDKNGQLPAFDGPHGGANATTL